MRWDDYKIKKSFFLTLNSFRRLFPIMVGIIFLMGLVRVFISPEFVKNFMPRLFPLDILGAASLGSFMTGNPIISYILGGELLKVGMSLVAVLAFLVSWVTVGFIQLPAEMYFLGRKFALLRNFLSFIFSILVAFITVFIFNFLVL